MNAPSSTRAAVGALIAVLLAFPAHAKDVVNVYSYRQPFLITPMFDAFTRETGIGVNVVHAKKGLVERLEQEGANSPADLIFTVDIGRLTDAARAGVTQPVRNATLEANIPAQYRDPDHHWFGLTTRARIIVASKDRVPPGAITSYEDLADPMWKGRVCTRSGKHAYMVALTAAMIAHHGEAKAEAWLRGVKANLARRPQGNDRAQVKAIMEGVCDVAVINHYYMGKMLADKEQSAWAESVNIVFPNQQSYGTHMNVSGMALTASSPNRENAVRLMVFLSEDLAQQMYAEQNFEYPVKQGVPWSGLLKSFGSYEADDLDLADHHRGISARLEAAGLADEAGHVRHRRDDAGLLHRHGDEDVLAVDVEVDAHAEGQLERPDDVLHHLVGRLQREGARVERPDVRVGQLGALEQRGAPLGGAQAVEPGDAAAGGLVGGSHGLAWRGVEGRGPVSRRGSQVGDSTCIEGVQGVLVHLLDVLALHLLAGGQLPALDAEVALEDGEGLDALVAVQPVVDAVEGALDLGL